MHQWLLARELTGLITDKAGRAANLMRSAICTWRTANGIEIGDVFREPKRALVDGILMTPTLVKLVPSPARRNVGTLSHSQPVLLALGLESTE